MTVQPKAFDRLVNIAPQSSFLSRANSLFFTMEKVHFGYWTPYKIRIDISRKFIFQKIVDLIIQTPFVNFWNIWKNTNRSVVSFFFPSIFFVQGTHFHFLKVFNVFSVFDALIRTNIYV